MSPNLPNLDAEDAEDNSQSRLPFVASVLLDERLRIQLPKGMKALFPWMRGPVELVAECMEDGEVQILQPGPTLSSSPSDEPEEEDDWIRFRSRHHRVSVDGSWRLGMSALMRDHLAYAAPDPSKLMAIFSAGRVRLMSVPLWRRKFLRNVRPILEPGMGAPVLGRVGRRPRPS